MFFNVKIYTHICIYIHIYIYIDVFYSLIKHYILDNTYNRFLQDNWKKKQKKKNRETKNT